jgi:monomeric isocitrate dehydrogenase
MSLADEKISEVSERTGERKIMSNKKIYYYRIFDDTEKLNYLKSSLSHEEVERWLREYERTHNQYLNPEFISYLREHDTEAEIIEISDISY